MCVNRFSLAELFFFAAIDFDHGDVKQEKLLLLWSPLINKLGFLFHYTLLSSVLYLMNCMLIISRSGLNFFSGFNFTTAQVVCITAMINHKFIICIV